MTMRTVLLIAALTATPALSATEKCDFKTMDECTKNALPFSVATSMGATKEEIEAECEQTRTSLKCLKEQIQSKCIKSGIAQGVFKLMIEGAEKVSTERCDSSHPKHQEYLKYIPCLNKIGSQLQGCEKQMTVELEANNKQPLNERVPRSCCAFSKLEKCIRDAAHKGCSAKHAEYAASIINGVAEATVDTVCTRFSEETCKKFSPLKVSQRTTYETLMPILVEILNV